MRRRRRGPVRPSSSSLQSDAVFSCDVAADSSPPSSVHMSADFSGLEVLLGGYSARSVGRQLATSPSGAAAAASPVLPRRRRGRRRALFLSAASDADLSLDAAPETSTSPLLPTSVDFPELEALGRDSCGLAGPLSGGVRLEAVRCRRRRPPERCSPELTVCPTRRRRRAVDVAQGWICWLSSRRGGASFVQRKLV